MTRATISLLSGDIKSYLYYNAMALPLIAALLLAIHKSKFRGQKTIDIVVVVMAISTAVYFILRIIFGLLPT